MTHVLTTQAHSAAAVPAKTTSKRPAAIGAVLIAFLSALKSTTAANRGAAYQILGNQGSEKRLERELTKFSNNKATAAQLRNPDYLRSNALTMLELQNQSIDITNSNSRASNEIQSNENNMMAVGDLARADSKMIFEDVRSR